MKIDETGYEIKEVKLRADRKNIKSLFVDGKRLTKRDRVEFTCQECGKDVELLLQNFLYKPEFLCRDCLRNKTRKESGWSMPESAKKIISEKKKGVQLITDYFDFICPICGKTFKYRNTKVNKKKKYCSKKCQLKVWSSEWLS